MLRATDLTKHYGPTLALDRLSLEVPEGAIFGLLGPNGAGKTTFLRLVMGFIFADAGQLDRGGLAPAGIGYLPERAFYPPRVSLESYLSTVARLVGLHGPARREAVARRLEQVGLSEVTNRRLADCSRGMLQRLGLAQALLGDPALVVLDEPVLGLDPAAQKFMREQILSLGQEGKTVLLSSHHLDEVARICSHVAVLHRGRLMRSGPLAAILAPRAQVTLITGPLPADLPPSLLALGPEVTVEREQIQLIGEAVAYKTQVLRMLLDADVDIRQLNEQRTTLEEVYLEATGA